MPVGLSNGAQLNRGPREAQCFIGPDCNKLLPFVSRKHIGNRFGDSSHPGAAGPRALERDALAHSHHRG
jgi:hypothetical protein